MREAKYRLVKGVTIHIERIGVKKTRGDERLLDCPQ